jgi:TolB protein
MMHDRTTRIILASGALLAMTGCRASRTASQAESTQAAGSTESASVTPASAEGRVEATSYRAVPASGAGLDASSLYRPTTDEASEPAQPTTINVARVTFADEGGDFDPAVSRDGTTLVFASTQHRDKADIYTKRVDSRVVTRLTNDPGQDLMPTISPDGTMIAFASDRTGNWDVFVMPVTGGKAVQVTNSPEQEIAPSWSPDGARLVYSRLGQSSSRWEMWVARIAKPDVASFLGYGLFPKWNPIAGSGTQGSDRLCYQLGKERGRRGFSVWTVDVGEGDQAGNPAEIIGSATDALINPTWSADGKWIVYAQVPLEATDAAGWLRSDARGGLTQASLWMISSEGEGNVRLTTGQGLALSPVWSRDQRLYFVSDRNGVENIWAMDVGQAMRSAQAMISPANVRMTPQTPLARTAPKPVAPQQPANAQPMMQAHDEATPESESDLASVPDEAPEHE